MMSKVVDVAAVVAVAAAVAVVHDTVIDFR